MRKLLTKRIKDRSGFSLAEVLVALLIVLMVSGIVAAGIPAAIRAYNTVIDSANAQVLLSTAITELKSELGTATDVKELDATSTQNVSGETQSNHDGKSISYVNNLGIRNEIKLEETTGETTAAKQNYVIYVQEYADLDESEDYYHPLVSKAASTDKLYVTYDTVSYDNGIVTFGNLVVRNRNTKAEMTDPVDFKVRVLTETS